MFYVYSDVSETYIVLFAFLIVFKDVNLQM